MILRGALAQLAIGLTLGLAGAFVLSDVLWAGGTIIIPAGDPLTYAAVAILLSLVAIAAALLPARRATGIDPVVALRVE
jgi:ABC-type antimicrobial peptide transport system permease subunit